MLVTALDRHLARPRHRGRGCAALLLAASLLALAAPEALGDSSGPARPSAAVVDAGIGTATWQNPANALTSNNSYAQAGLAASTSRYLKLTGFGFSIPAGATISGVTVSVEHNVSGTSGDIRDASVKLLAASAVTGAERADTSTRWSWSSTKDFTATYGSASDLWGTALTPADVNSSGFGVAIAARNLNSANTFAKIDSVTIQVTYSTGGTVLPPPPVPPSNSTAPSLSGTPQVGQALTATTGTWSGTAPISYQYQWRTCDSTGASCTDLSGATGSSYSPTSSDIGDTLRARVTATNSAGSAAADSAASAPVADAPPPPVDPPTSGPGPAGVAGPSGPSASADDAGIGTAAWQNPPNAYSSNNAYAQTALKSATSHYLKLTGFRFSVPPDALISGLIVNVERNVSGTSGDIRDASVKLVKGGTVTGSDRADPTTRWAWSGSSDLTAAFGSTSDRWGTTLTPADVNSPGFGVALAARNLNSANTFAKVDSVTITIFYGGASLPPSRVTAPAVSGLAQVGQTLTATPGTWSGTAPISYAYQWRGCDQNGASCADISGATDSTYAVRSSDGGRTLRVRVTATNASGSSTSDSSATGLVMSVGGVTDIAATGYSSSKIYDPPDAPYTAWTGAWKAPDGSLWTAFTQSSGTYVSGMPQWARNLLGSTYVANRDHWDLRNVTVYMSSTDHGQTWTVQQPLGAGVDDVMTTPDALGNPGDPADCTADGLGSGCPAHIDHGFTPQADIALSDGTLLRRVNGDDMRYDRAVAATAFLQRLTPGASSWTGVQYLLDPATSMYQVSRIRRLSDGRLIALGEVSDTPAGSQPGFSANHSLLMVSSDEGQTWSGGALPVAPGVTQPSPDEWDVAELPSGDLLAIFRTEDGRTRQQGLLAANGSGGWTLTQVTTPPFGHSGHPELLAEPNANAVVYMATDDVSGKKGIWYLPFGDAQAGSNKWTLLPFTSSNGDGLCSQVGSVWNCSTRYYPRSVEDSDGTIAVLSHSGFDDPYPPPGNEAIYAQTFKLQGGATASYEAESSVNSLSGGAAVVSCSACSGGQRVGSLGSGGTLTFNGVNVPLAGTYQVTVAYTDGSDTGRSADVSVNGGSSQTVAFTPTGGFDVPGTATVTLQLAAGANTVTFGNATDLAPDVDKLVVPARPG